MAEQEVSKEQKIGIVNKINKRYKNLMHDVNKAEQMGIKVDIEVHSAHLFAGGREHYMIIECTDRDLIEQAKMLKTGK